ncbi:hypothetical protein [Bacillus phage phiAGATE]|uniref:Uncharacterized protein n=1 Tax=Bacillus phage phiAGATE TaxID=1204533 RepID=L0L960_9CAUD|nr:hypothetical protein G380_gp023 [Bacillus phage phiAGATE]AGB62673.1 hypothetical protein [Bacillus phage phiAGATE]
MKNIIRKINLYFFQEEELEKDSALLFYGAYLLAGCVFILLLSVIISTNIM